jgi:hypothetical protein
MRYLRGLLLALCLFSASASFALAWPGGAPRGVSVSGPGINGEITVVEPALLVGLGPEQFVDFIESARPPAGLSGGFALTRYTRYDNLSQAEFVDRFMYYPHPSGGRGYVQYLGSEQGGGEAFKGKWFYPTLDGYAAVLKLLKFVGATIGESQALPAADVHITLDPASIPQSASSSFKVGFSLSRQGRAVLLSDALTIYAIEAGATSRTVFTAHPAGAEGHYVADIKLPRDGLWFWMVDLGALEGEREMTPWRIGVNAPPPAPVVAPGNVEMQSSAPNRTGEIEPVVLTSAVLLTLAVVAVAAWFGVRRRAQSAR